MTYNAPTHLARAYPQDAFRYMITWAHNAIDQLDIIYSEYDPGSEVTMAARAHLNDCCANIFGGMMHANPEIRVRLGLGLDVALDKQPADENLDGS
jgi:hypothetical protein